MFGVILYCLIKQSYNSTDFCVSVLSQNGLHKAQGLLEYDNKQLNGYCVYDLFVADSLTPISICVDLHFVQSSLAQVNSSVSPCLGNGIDL